MGGVTGGESGWKGSLSALARINVSRSRDACGGAEGGGMRGAKEEGIGGMRGVSAGDREEGRRKENLSARATISVSGSRDACG
jgi:hypothetical protein